MSDPATQTIDYDALAKQAGAISSMPDYDALAKQAGAISSVPPPAAKQPSAWQVLTQPTEKTDKEYLGYTGPAGVVGATVHGFNDVARNTVGAVKGAVSMFDPRTQPGEDAFTSLPIVRALHPLISAAKQVPEIPQAIRDINASPDPTGSYLNAAQDTAAQGAGQALTAIAAEAAPKALAGSAQIVKRTVPPLVRGIAKGTNTVLAKAIGAAAGAAVGHYIPIPGATLFGTGIGAALGKELLPNLRVPGEEFGLPKPTYPGAPLPADAPTGEFVDSMPQEASAPFAPAQVVEPKLLPAAASGASRRVPGEVAPEDVNTPDASTLAGKKGIRVVLPQPPKLLSAAPEEAAAGSPVSTPSGNPPTPTVNTSPSALANLLGRGLGYEPPPKPVPGKPIYSRSAPSAPAQPVPEGMTPVESAGMRAYSYDAPSQTFTAQWPDGSLHQYGEVTPEEVQAFEAAKSKGRALLDIKNNHVHLAANYGKGWINKVAAVRSAVPDDPTPQPADPSTAEPTAPAEASAPDEDLTERLQQSVQQAEARKAAPNAAGEGEQGRPFVAPESSTTYGTRNRVVSADEAAQARANLQSKMFRSNAGFDPTMIADAAKLGAYHLEAGLREFGAWSQKMIDDLGEQVKPHLEALWARIGGDPSETSNAPTFYSKAAKVVNDKVGGSGSGDQILSTLRNAGVKEDEIKWMGLDDFLKGKPKVSKADLQQFINDNEIQLEESTRGANSNLDQIKELQSQRAKVKAQNDQLYMLQLRFLGFEQTRPLLEAMRTGDDAAIQSAIRNLPEGNRPGAQRFVDTDRQLKALDREADALGSSDTRMWNRQPKYEQYTLPGDKSNYTEMMMRLPEQGTLTALRNEYDAAQTERTQYLQTLRPVPGDVELRFHDAQTALRKAENTSPSFNSAHFDEPNILAHVRFDDRVAADEAKTLFLEEVQSDWHQQGKKLGYQGNPMTGNVVQQPSGQWRIEWPNGTFSGGYGTQDAAMRAMPERAAMNAKSGVPNAPFKSDWHELAMKRMLRYAAENGYDRIAWTTGEQQAARYDLSKQVDAIHYNPETQRLTAEAKGDRVIDKQLVKPEQLVDYIGKDPAQKLMATEPNVNGLRTLSGDGLKVGGDWAKALYDRAIPNFLNKYTKKWGAKVGDTVLPNSTDVDEHFDLTEAGGGWRLVDKTQNEGRGTFVGPIFKTGAAAEKWLEDQGYLDQKVHSLDITPAMKKSVLKEGQPISKIEEPSAAAEMATA